MLISFENRIKSDPDVIHPYTYDSSNYQGFAEQLFIPEDYSELIKFVKSAYDSGKQITVSGAGTGIAGGRVPEGGAVISTEKFKDLFLLNSNSVRIGAAVTLNELDNFLKDHNLFLPPNPTEINASIGGNVSTNASGARTFKYGAIRNYVNRLKIILSNGDQLNIGRGEIFAENNILKLVSLEGNEYKIQLPNYIMPAVKNASGYYTGSNIDAIDLFIGSEGTLGIVTEIELTVQTKPENILGGIVFFDDNDNLFNFIVDLRDQSKILNKTDIELNNEITARLIEYFDKNSLILLRNKYPEIPESAIGAVWFEQEYSKQFEDILMDRWYDYINLHTQLGDETWFALTEKEHLKLKEFRHELPLQVYENLSNNSQRKVGLDTAVPDKDFRTLFNFYLDKFPQTGLDYVVFGHIGNSHLHANIFCKNDDEFKLAKEVYDEGIQVSLGLQGTVSAEHGIGKLKKPYLIKMYGAKAVEEMKNVKQVLDDKLILNIGTMFDL
ncbi:MAG: FAD-binding oxidoreductase [Candidatus Kapaibacterium sp.]|jgi:D-lactate dehydrogenase (cytochrome)